MSFLQFAYNNVRRNKRAYAAYLLSSAFAVMIFFIYAIFLFHPQIANSLFGKTTQMGMKTAEYIIFVFSFLFVLFSVSAFLKTRKKEFGLLTILGSTSSQLNRLIFLENMIIGFIAILIGLIVGFVVSKIFLIVGAMAIGMKALPFYFPWKAIGLTVASFMSLFFVISILTLFFVRNNKVMELLQGAKKPKTEPKASWVLSLLTILAIIGAVVLGRDFNSGTWLYVTVLVLIGTYLMYTQLSVYMIRWMKKNRRFFRNGTNMLWLSELAYKMKDNARIFFMVTIVTSIACSAVSIVLILNGMIKEELDTRFQLVYSTDAANPFLQKNKKLIDQKLKENHIQAHHYQITVKDLKSPELKFVSVIKQSDFNKFSGVIGLKPVNLSQKESFLILFDNPKKKKINNVTLSGETKQTYPVTGQTESGISRFIYDTLVIPDSEFAKVKGENTSTFNLYHVPNWENRNPTAESMDTKIGVALSEELSKQKVPVEYSNLFYSSAASYTEMKSANNMILFIGLFIALVFSISMASFLYFKLYTDLADDKKQYHAISKIGLSIREMKKVVNIQIGILFFVPFLFSAIQALWGVRVVVKTQAYDVFQPTIISICAFFIVQLICFLVVRWRYWSQVKEAMV
ncbi:FtsX-like permease family protein [Shimazuella kribbensis]|uniref:FtsX-like permease family protein n=1 Tax=Shimazuella kribbensis TaxID=139808 RepID=UPI00041D3946|nr:ABC transporter permease [Shimazuella kribbensis]